MMQGVPDGDDKPRAICTICGKIAYQNPKMVVGCLVEHGNKILLVQRNIQPAKGLWTLPAGFMEIGESAVQGATRETWEEAGADVEVVSPFIHMDVPLIGHSYMIFRAKLKTPHFAPGPESLDCKLFAVEDIPFDTLAFSSMLVTLNLYIKDLKAGKPRFHYCIVNKSLMNEVGLGKPILPLFNQFGLKSSSAVSFFQWFKPKWRRLKFGFIRAGAAPSDIHAHTVDNYFEC
ncbi:hypothetical protein GIB67_023218 [Kingdonia uniflora]|uniref:Nudix hydrolase domain-containing protein n=1 Tax=Kingdonia uniflora TaxID=39325 RepID=A0A7J7L948_9MAGN|nr:hypothetical protein GIB67_023218 [Kingdonia uniflora]